MDGSKKSKNAEKAPEKSKEGNKETKEEKVNEGLDAILKPLGYASYLFTAISLVGLVSPFFKNMWRKCFKDGKMKIAEVRFEADEAKYTASFDLDNMKWMLTSDYSISQQETMQFFETQFFAKFNEQCKNYIGPILASKDNMIEELKKQKSKIESKQYNFFMKLLKNADRVASNMFDPHYIT